MESNFQQRSERSQNYEDALLKLEKSCSEGLLKEGELCLGILPLNESSYYLQLV